MKKKRILNFYDLLIVEMPDSILFDSLTEFEVDGICNPNAPASIRFQEIVAINKSNLTMVSNYMAYSDDIEEIYIIDKNGKFCTSVFGKLDDANVEIDYEKGFTADYLLNFIVKPYLRGVLSKNGLAFIHASSFSKNDKATLLAAWAHTGKTSTLLRNIKDGAEYLGDDLSVIDRNGFIRPFPVPINLFYYNFKQIPEIKKDLSLWFKLKFILTNTISSLFGFMNSLARSSKMKYLYYAGKTFFDAASHVPFRFKKEYLDRINIVRFKSQKVVLLERTASINPDANLVVKDLKTEEFARRMQHCLNYEFQRFNELALSALWVPFYNGADLPNNQETEIYRQFASRVNLKHVRIPQRMNFSSPKFLDILRQD
jgi:hypothetical protein